MAMYVYVPRCIFCGKSGGATRRQTPPSYSPPMMGGKCPSSPDGKHKPRWEEQ